MVLSEVMTRATTPRWADMVSPCGSDDEFETVLTPLYEDSYQFGIEHISKSNSAHKLASNLDSAVRLSDGPTDFSFLFKDLLHNSSSAPLQKVSPAKCIPTLSEDKTVLEDEVIKTRLLKTPLHLDLNLDIFDENSNSNSKREREGELISSPKHKMQKANANNACDCQSKDTIKGKGKGKGENQFGHQCCFNWNRKPDGCSEPCPNGRVHACEFCGSPDHRGTMCDRRSDVVDGPVGKSPKDFSFLFKQKKLNPSTGTDLSQEKMEKKTSGGDGVCSYKGKGCSHQRCFEWSRKVDGCSDPCPNGRAHVCEFCGSPDHRGVQSNCQQLASRVKPRR